MRTVQTAFLAFLVFPFLSLTALAQGLLVNESANPARLPRVSGIIAPIPPRPVPRPQPPRLTYAITDLSVDATLKDQIAQVNVSQTFKNTGSTSMEVSFVFPLPYDGAVESLTLMIDGKEYPAKLQTAAEARKTYEEIVRRNQDPALLEWIGSGMFKTSVFPVPVGASRTITLRYAQLLRVDGGVTDFLFPLGTAKYTAGPVGKIGIRAEIESTDEIKNVYSPTSDVKIERPGPHRASVSMEMRHVVPNDDFRLLFDSGKGEVGTKLLSYRKDDSDDGYFMLLASPKIASPSPDEKPLSKTVLFVIDRSGSMAGKKIVQARDALKFVLGNLNDGDMFNIIPYDGSVTTFKPEIQPVDSRTRAEAIAYADTIRDSGSTNIDEALHVSLGMLKEKTGPAYVLFLTDGCPTVGELNEMKLAENARQCNTYGARIFTFGVGHDVNSRLLDRLARDSKGQSMFVSPQENIEANVSILYNRISTPVFTDAVFDIVIDGSPHGTNRVYPNGRFDLFSGEQLVVVGRYSRSGTTDIVLRGKRGDADLRFHFDGDLIGKSNDSNNAFIERLWAMRRIGEIIDELDLKGENEELVQELLALSTKHGVLTPYTSFLAEESTSITDVSANAARTSGNTQMLRATDGVSGFRQRAAKSRMQFAQNTAAPAELALDAEFALDASQAGFGGGAPTQAKPSRPARETVRTVHNRAFFQKSGNWVDATLTDEQMKPENVRNVTRFSEEYFRLIDTNGIEFARYLVFDEPVLVRFNNQTYQIE